MRKSGPINPARHTLGLICEVYRGALGHDGTRKGITSKHAEVLLLGPDVDGPFGERTGLPILYLHYWATTDGRVLFYASPDPNNGTEYMFGGNFIYTPDNRLPSGRPIPVHDRKEG